MEIMVLWVISEYFHVSSVFIDFLRVLMKFSGASYRIVDKNLDKNSFAFSCYSCLFMFILINS